MENVQQIYIDTFTFMVAQPVIFYSMMAGLWMGPLIGYAIGRARREKR